MSLFEQLEALLSPLIASDLGVSAAEGPEQLQAIQDLLAEAEDPQVGFDWLGERIATLPPTAGSWVGVYLGGLVERGRLKGAVSAPGVLAFFRGAVEALSEDVEHPEWNACAGLLGPTVITQLAADEATLDAVRNDGDLVAMITALASQNDACYYVEGMVRLRSGKLIVLDPGAKQAVMVNYENVGSCFHLFTLLQSVMTSAWSQGRSQPAEMLAVAWGEHAPSDQTPADTAWFHYSQPRREANLAAMLPGEATLDAIGKIGDQQVLVVFPPELAEREWAASFFAPQLSLARPSVSVERDLSHSEVITLVGQLS